ncbi:MAG TPA: hypothetical protein VF242_05825 [Nitrososphaeraceae archaeon]
MSLDSTDLNKMSTEGNSLEMFPILTTIFMSIAVASAFIIDSLITNHIKYSSKLKGGFRRIYWRDFFCCNCIFIFF